MTELPRGWVVAPLGELSEVIAGQAPPGSDVNDHGEGVPFFQGKAEFGELYPEVRKWTTNPSRAAAVGDVLLSVRAPVGPTNLAPTDCAIGRGLMAVRQHKALEERYVLWALRASEEQLRSFATGSTFEAVTGPVVRKLGIPVAPRGEQERIVAAIEEAFSKLDAGEAGLRTVRQLLKRMQDAILAAAVTGRLVPQDPTDTPATKLLADLGIESVSDRAFEVPATWAVVRLSDLLSEPLSNGRSVRSRVGGFPVLRLTCLNDGRIDLGERKEGEWDAGAAAPFLVRKGDFFVSRGNGSLDLVGRGGLVVDAPDPVAYPDTLIRVRVPNDYLEPSLLALVWNSAVVRQQLEGQARTTAGIYKVNQGMLNGVRLPLPPREEQARIVTEFERQMSFVDACERAIEAGMERSAALRRSVLKAAFEGRLVPQDPTDEPASVLLERIRAERAAAPKAKTRRAKAKS